ncbi:MAG: DUF4177 domain-containing protein [Pseudomonadota bacterium]
MDRREYKTVAMPQALRAGRRLGKSKGDRVAAAMAEIINREAQSGWRYAGSDHVAMTERAGLFGGRRTASYTVLVFDRAASAETRVEPDMAAAPPRRASYPEEPGRDGVRAKRRDPADASMMGRGGGVADPRAAASGQPRRRSRDLGFDESPRVRGAGAGLSARDDDDMRGGRPMRRREARMAARRSVEAERGARVNGSREDPEERFRGLVETMRQQRDRD